MVSILSCHESRFLFVAGVNQQDRTARSRWRPRHMHAQPSRHGIAPVATALGLRRRYAVPCARGVGRQPGGGDRATHSSPSGVDERVHWELGVGT